MKRLILVLMVLLSPFTFHLSLLHAFTNPILPYDYSDPDVIRLGKYYMTYSTFASTPGLQILASDDGIKWTIVFKCFATIQTILLASAHALEQ